LAAAIEPEANCPHCPRLVAFRTAQRSDHADWFNAPVPSFGEIDARLLIVGLAPGLKGANRTGRPFTGDFAGDLLYATLVRHGFAAGRYDRRADDGLALVDCRVTNAVRCVPPQNKPTGEEVRNCLPYLEAEIAAMENLRLILCLGQLSHNAVLRTFGLRQNAWRFAHGAMHHLPDGRPMIADSYHCSRYNTNTGRLTEAMFDTLVGSLREALDRPV